MSAIVLERGRVQAVWAGHPWVFKQAIGRIEGAPSPGDVVDVLDPSGNFLGRGYWSPKSAIPVRIASRERGDALDGASIGRALDRAVQLRARVGLPNAETDGYRLVHAEGDSLPGLVVDCFGSTAVVQFLTLGMKLREQDVFAQVARATRAKTVLELPNAKAAEREGFAAELRVARGPDAAAFLFRERGMEFELDVHGAQKTGFYFDQRDNRSWVEALSAGAEVLDAYSFVGSFALFAARGGAAQVVAVDSSPLAVATGSALAHRLGLGEKVRFEKADARSRMQELAQQKRSFDIVILDPPKLAPTVRHLDRALTMYRKLNTLAARLVRPDGVLVSCSCSAAVSVDDLLRAATLGARDVHRDLTLFHTGFQGADHPTPAAFPEGRYLKSLFFRVT